MIINRIIKKKEISYEIICAMLRMEPRCLYLEFEDHPTDNIMYTLNLERSINIKMLKLLSNNEKFEKGIIDKIKILIIRNAEGDIKKINMFEISDCDKFLLNNLIASLIG